MKIHSATTNLELPFRPIMDDSPVVYLPAGTEVTAIEVGDQRWHLNTKHEGRDYDRYVSTACLQVGPAIAAFNEGADSFFADSL